MNRSLSPEYLAGFFDGEGCVHCSEYTQRGSRVVQFQIQIANSHEEIIKLIQTENGGSYELQHPSRLGKNKVWLWRIGGVASESFARLILPHTVLKKEQIELFLELRATVVRAGRRHVSDEVWERRAELIAAIKAAKRSHLVPFEVAE